MTQQELIKENEKLTGRLRKAVEVFNEQKATIARQAEEIKSLKQKAEEGEKKDSEFFDQVNEIESLKEELANAKNENDKLLAENDGHKKEVGDLNAKVADQNETIKRYTDTLMQIQHLVTAVSDMPL